MPVYFLDSSVVYKRYIYETGSNWVRSVAESNPPPPQFLSQLAQVEVIAALRKSGRVYGWDSAFVDTAVNIFERHLALSVPTRKTRIYRIVPLSNDALALAAQLCNTYWDPHPHPLRSLDAIQLSCALIVRRELPDNLKNDLIFATADLRLSAIAPIVGLRAFNPEHPET